MAKNFDNPYAAKLIGLWDFRDGHESEDTGLGDGVAQDGSAAGSAGFGAGWLYTHDSSGHFDVDAGHDAAFDLAEGTLTTSFRPYDFGPGNQTVVSRGLFETPEDAFEIRVTEDRSVELYHAADGTVVSLATDPGFMTYGDIIDVTYAWGPFGVTFIVSNTTQGTESTLSSDQPGLSFDITEEDEQSFVFGAREVSEGTYDQTFNGSIDYVAVLDGDVTTEALDGVVEGTHGDDLIDTTYLGDPEGDRVDAQDVIDPSADPNDDMIHAGGGDDTVVAGAGDDTVHAGSGNDSVLGGAGDDLLSGDSDVVGAGPVTREVFRWDLAPDPDDASLVDAGDTLAAGFARDTGTVTVSYSVSESDPSISTAFATRTQAVGNIDTGGDAANPNSALNSFVSGDGLSAEHVLDFSGSVQNISFRVNDIDGGGLVQVEAYDAEGNPVSVTLAGGPALLMSDEDSVAGDDTARSSGNYTAPNDTSTSLLVTIPGPVERIVLTHTQVGASDSGVFFTDVFFDAVESDPAAGSAGADTLEGGAGDDTLIGGEGADVLLGGDDRDTFVGATDGDVIDGGAGGDDYDVLALSGIDFEYASRTLDADGNSYSGTINLLDATGDVAGTFAFSEIERVVPCFTPGTLIATPRGEIAVEELKVGDRVITRDNGIQMIRWVGMRRLGPEDLKLASHLQPVLIRQGALGNGLPERDMMVSPNHRVLVANDKTALYFEDREVLVAAKHLTGLRGVDQVQTTVVTYIHFMFDQHEVVLSDGAWTESFQPGDQSLRGLDNGQRNEIFELFPDLKSEQGRAGYSSARRSLKRHEAKILLH